MGCFDSTCAFSRTAIHYGDEVLLVALNYNLYREDLLQTYNLSNRLFDIATGIDWKNTTTENIKLIPTEQRRKAEQIIRESRVYAAY